MSNYRRVLAAVDIGAESRQVAAAAAKVAAALDARLHILHVIETTAPPLGADFLPEVAASLTAQIRTRAKSHLGDIASEFGVPRKRQHVVINGRPAVQIRRIAESKKVDLIVVGSHGRHGLGLLLGATANGVLHGANCDVLSVRVDPTEGG